ncbi:MAG: hypothetical protein IT200_08470 [Thermoleophilia bacterium]|nr:hypothetical protein [Thermoleophilia bacterium]
MTAPRVPDGWLIAAADPAGDALDAAVEDLVGRLGAARSAAAGVAGAPPLGLRAVELAAASAHYVCAFEGPAFLVLDPGLRPVASRHAVLRHAAAGLLWEQLEGLVDAGRLRALAAAGGRLLASGLEAPAAVDAVEDAVQAALRVASWREGPLRAVASMTQVDVVSTLQERMHAAYVRFVAATEPLVERQDALGEDLVAALRAFEEAAALAGAGERLADRIGLMLPACDEGAAEMAGVHLTPLT